MEKTKVLESAGNFQVEILPAGSAAGSQEPTTISSFSHAMVSVREPRSGCKNSPGSQKAPASAC